MGDPVTATAIAGGASQAISTGNEIYQQERKYGDAKRVREANEQDSMRREATYRQDRAILMNQIEAFYKKRGIAMPETNFPGQGTSRPLPGDADPYAGYDVDPSMQTHQPKPQNEAQQAINMAAPQSGQVDPQKAAQVAGVFHGPDHKAKVMAAELGSQIATPTQAPAQNDAGANVDTVSTEPIKPVEAAAPTTTNQQFQPIMNKVGQRYGW